MIEDLRYAFRTLVKNPGCARQTVNRLDPDLGVGHRGTLSEFARASVAREPFSAALLAGFAAIAVVLAAIGIYGVMAYASHAEAVSWVSVRRWVRRRGSCSR